MTYVLRLFRTRPLTGPDAGWFRPTFAVILAVLIPSGLAMLFVSQAGIVFSGPPKDGSGYTWADHLAIVTGALSVSFLVSWMLIPFAILALRLALMTGWAGLFSAITVAVALGLPFVHVALMGDVTTEENAILPHITVAIALLGASVWATYWALYALRRKKSDR